MIHLATSDEIPRLQAAIMSHFLFEYIHPFYDGNGRTGRYLLALYLNHDLTMPTVLSLSRTIAENKNAYYKAFVEAEAKLNCGELTLFVNTLLGFIREAQDELIGELEIMVDQLDKGETICEQFRQKGLRTFSWRLSERFLVCSVLRSVRGRWSYTSQRR